MTFETKFVSRTVTNYSDKASKTASKVFEKLENVLNGLEESLSEFGDSISKEESEGTISMVALGGVVEIEGPITSLTVNGQKVELPKPKGKEK